MKSAFLLLALLLLSFGSYAQSAAASDTLKSKIDSLEKTLKKPPVRFTFDGIRIGADVVYPIGTMIDFNKERYEISIDAGFMENRLLLVADYGYSNILRGAITLPFNGFDYQSVGSYFRLGLDYNYMHKRFKEDVMFAGIRYAVCSFNHTFNYRGTSEAWGFRRPFIDTSTGKAVIIDERFRGTITESNLSAAWAEVVTGLKVRVWKQLFLGYTIRLMIRSQVKGEDQLAANDLPGFGTTNRTARLGLNYYIAYRLRWAK